MRSFLEDLRHAARLLARNRRFTLAAGVAIALGIGANVTFFSLVDAVLLRPLPYREPDRLAALSEWHPQRGRYGKVSGADFQEWGSRASRLESLACYWDAGYTVTGSDRPETLVGWQFSGNLFGLLGARPLLGRTLLPDDARPGQDGVVVISERLWHRRFAATPAVLGQTLALDGRAFTIVGVMPREFAHPNPSADVWTPLVLTPELLANRELHPLRVVARLREGVTLEQAQSELSGLAAQLAREQPQWNTGFTAAVRPIRDLYVGDVRTLLWLLQGAVFVLLLIACSNVANLVLARAASREREIALRLAMGVRPGHLLRQFVAEGALLAVLGTAGGLALAAWGLEVVPRWLGERLGRVVAPDSVPGWISPSVLLVTLAATLAIGLALGVVPLVRGLRLAQGPLRSETRGATDGPRTRRLRQAFVVTQVALSVCLLIGAGLLVRSFSRLQMRSFGFQTERVLTASLSLPPNRYPGLAQNAAFLRELLASVKALPGVEAAGVVNALPLTGQNARRPYQVPGQANRDQVADFRVATPDYFAAMGIPLKRGRLFEDRDRAGAEEVAIVNETLAKRLWPDGDPLGRQLLVPDMMTPATRTVVGVVGDTRHNGLAAEPDPEIYRPAYQAYWPFYGMAVRVRAAAPASARELRAALASLDRDLPLGDVRWLDERASDSVSWRRSSMALLGAFAAAALFLTFFGIYSVASYAVVQRSREIGLRVAIGAAPRDIARSFLVRGAVQAACGLAAGVAASLFLSRLLETLLFGVESFDAVTYGAVASLTLLVTLVATLGPALAAARVDPTVSLRAE